MTLRAVPDIDDSLAANPEPRADLGYQEADAPRSTRRRPGAATFWTFVERDARPGEAAGGPIGCTLTCRKCNESAPVLHADPATSHPQRVVCGRCQGEANAAKLPRREGAR